MKRKGGKNSWWIGVESCGKYKARGDGIVGSEFQGNLPGCRGLCGAGQNKLPPHNITTMRILTCASQRD